MTILEDLKALVAKYEAPIITESLEGTQSTKITDTGNSVWGFDDVKMLKDGIDTGGRGSMYAYHNHTVYGLGTDNNWWMYQNGTWTLFGAKSPITVPPPVYNTKTAVNLTNFGAAGGVEPFINIFRRSSRWWNWGGQTVPWYIERPDNWVRQVPPGGEISNLVTVNDIEGETDLTELRSGKYILLWKNELEMRISGSGCEAGTVTAPGRYEFNVPATIPVDGILKLANPSFNLIVTNPTTVFLDVGPITVADIQYPALIHSGDETDFLAGKHYQKAHINALSSADYVRTMDWNNSNPQGVDAYGKVYLTEIQPKDYMTMDHRTYVTTNQSDTFLPPEEIGYLAKEADIGIFNTIPSKTTDAAMDYWIQQFSKTVSPTWLRMLLSEFGNENWNVGWPWTVGNRHLIDVIGPTVQVVDINGRPSTNTLDILGSAVASRSLAMWQIMEKYIPRARHGRVLGSQFVYPDAFGGRLMYRDPITGEKLADIADYYAVAPYWGADLADYPTIESMLDGKIWLKGDQWWIDRCTRAIDTMPPYVQRCQDYIGKYAPKLKLTMYEGGGWPTEVHIPHSTEARYPEAKEFAKFLRDFAEGEAGKIVTQYYWEKVVKGNFVLYNQFTHQGYTMGVQQGLHLSQYRPDTPRQALFRTFGK